ncbi:MAG: hypothetical protein U0746_02570 [Gemmataceae bacterium]
MRVVVIAADGLRPDYLGCYGCEWVATPTIDRWAAEGIVYDWHFADSPGTPEPSGLYDRLGMAGIKLSHVPFDRDADEPFGLKPTRRALRRAIEGLGDSDPAVLWIDIGLLLPPWDVPDETLADYFFEDDEEDESDDQAFPWPDKLPIAIDDNRTLDRVQRTYAAAITAFDTGLAKLWADLDKRGWGDQATWAITSFRGLPLGERSAAGFANGLPHEELVHLPLIVRLPRGEGGDRIGALTQPPDLYDAICRWVGLSVESSISHDVITIAHIGVRTPSRYLIATDPPQLYLKPDDRWEVNDVAQQHLEDVETLVAHLNREAK